MEKFFLFFFFLLLIISGCKDEYLDLPMEENFIEIQVVSDPYKSVKYFAEVVADGSVLLKSDMICRKSNTRGTYHIVTFRLTENSDSINYQRLTSGEVTIAVASTMKEILMLKRGIKVLPNQKNEIYFER